jgi:NAD(P)-dependent dehydrogenase (short-subunit alcohol dehydrogenase family)
MNGNGRTAVVTGGAGGIGAAIGAVLARQGVDVHLADREKRVVDTAQRLGCSALLLDIADPGTFAGLEALPSLDVLVNCAAVAPDARFDEPGFAETFRRTLAVNVSGMLAVTTAALPQLRRSAAPRILNVGSIQGFAAAADTLAYSTSKGAVNSLTRALAVDLAPDGILVNAIAPGFVDTAMARGSDGASEYETEWFRAVYVEHGRIPLRRPARAEEIAEAAEFFVSERNTYVTGSVLAVDGGLLATF